MKLRAGLVTGALLALLALPGGAAAQSTEATLLFDEGRKAMAAKDYGQAITKLQQSQKLDPAVGTLLNLAECFATLGRSASAWGTYRDAASLAASTKQLERERYATRRARELEPTLSHLEIALKAEARVPGLVISRNGMPVPEGLWGAAIPVDPGAQHVEASAPERVTWKFDVDVAENAASAHVDVPVLALQAGVSAAGATAAGSAAPAGVTPAPPPANSNVPPPGTLPATIEAPPPEAQPEPHASSTLPVVGWVAVAAGGLSLGTGIFVFADGRSKISDADCPNQVCVRGIGDKSLHDAGRAHEKLGVGLGVAGAAVAAAGVVLLLWPEEGEHAVNQGHFRDIRLEVAASGASVRGAWW